MAQPEPKVGSEEVEATKTADGRRPWTKNPFVWAAIAGIITIPLLRPCLRHVPEPPPVIAQLPAFTLVAQDGQPFGSADLRGQVYIANTFFTHCQTVCPPLMRAVASLQERLGREAEVRGEALPIRLVSITVDPFNDTPERLREYAREYGVDFERWTLVTGDEQAIRELVVGGFMTDMGEPEVDPANANLIHISHAARLVLVDGNGGIRGYYGTDEMGLDEVFHRAQHVLREMR